MNTTNINTTNTTAPQLISTAKVETVKGIINEASTLLHSMNRPDSAAVLKSEVESMKDRPYRIAVIGEFKTGKSTFINAAFLGQELLFSDIMEATCVPTELAWGEKPLMKIFPYLEKNQQTIAGSDSITIRDGEETPVEVTSPTAKDIRMETSADSAPDREFKARRISKVRVELPNALLKGITVLDSPGINSTSGAVVDAALRIVPSCDTVIFVTKGGQLSQSEEEFLRSGVLEQGIARAIIVINHFDNMMPLNDEGRKEHMHALRAKLRQFGKDHLQVTMVDSKAWLESIKSGDPIPKDAAEFTQILGDFIGKDLAKARLEKAMEVTKREIRSALLELTAVSTLQKKSDLERVQIAANLTSKTEEASNRLDNLRQDFESEFFGHLNQFRSSLKTGITSTINQFKGLLRAATDLSSLTDQLATMQSTMRPQIEAKYIDATRTLKRDLQVSNDRFTREVRTALLNLDTDMIPDIGKDVSLPPIPAPLVVILDYILVVIASPLPFVADIVLRLLADRFPEIRKIMPTGLAKTLAQGWIEKQLDQQFAETSDEIDRRIDSIKAEATAAVGKSLQSLLDAEVAPLKKALRSADEKKAPWNTEEITRYETELKALYNRSNEHCH
jgi:hypothetical protein